MIRAIIPCCGYGTRVGMKKNQSKELLPLPGSNTPMIQNTINICKQYNIEPFVLVRKEKKDLISYLKKQKVKYVVMKPGKEWAETVYNSQDHWSDKNILMLPDTVFSPVRKIVDVKKSLEMGLDTVFAVHKVDDLSKWGAVAAYCYAEKPTSGILAKWNKPRSGYAWGLIGFTEESGKKLFTTMQSKGLWEFNDVGTNIVFLDSFKDLTRK